jgi:hypothetical protein
MLRSARAAVAANKMAGIEQMTDIVFTATSPLE